MKRILEPIINEHLNSYHQIAMISGPRQVGKTTLANSMTSHVYERTYFNWDNLDDRATILGGPKNVAKTARLNILSPKPQLIIFDEIHKYKDWKTFLKGFFDSYQNEARIIVTGSSRLDVYKKGGDSLMGRYFHYRLHPLSLREIHGNIDVDRELQSFISLDPSKFENLLKFGGFPEPFLRASSSFSNRWMRGRLQQLFKEEVRDISMVNDLDQMELLGKFIARQVGNTIKYANLAKMIRVSEDTIKRWIGILESLYYCFSIHPWSSNVPRSLLKEPKIYLWDWTVPGNNNPDENFVASHLLKSVHCWNDMGLGEYGLYYIRDKEQREVDFLVVKNAIPWLLIEVKHSKKQSLSEHLYRFKEHLKVPHVFQVVFDMEFIEIDWTTLLQPKIIPVTTFVSQLM